MTLKKITIAGGGTLGSQIAWQSAFMGLESTLYDPFKKGLERSKEFHKEYAEIFKNNRGICPSKIDETISRIKYTDDLSTASKDADILSESIPENFELKKEFYNEISKIAPKKTIFTTNSSTMLPSYFAKYTDRPKMFLSLHFANGIWDANIAEVMGSNN